MRLIDADALKEKMRRTNRYFDVKFDIDDAPTVDAVEVVRCKDCKHYGYILTCGCSRIETSEYGIATMKPDDFCSHGERKDVTHEET